MSTQKTIFNVNDVASMVLDEESKIITLRQQTQKEPLYIHPEDDLYDCHLANFETMCTQLTDTFRKKEEVEGDDNPDPK